MKKSLILVGMLSIGYAYAQEGSVGINTETPKATLEIVPNATNLAGTTNEGIIIPKLTKARVVAIAADKLVEGTKVYVTDEVTAADTQFIGAGKGFYFYNGAKWVKQLTSDTDTNSELWEQTTENGETKTYLKASKGTFDIFGFIDRGEGKGQQYIRVLGEPSHMVGDTNLAKYSEIVPNLEVITSKVLPLTNSLGSRAFYDFNRREVSVEPTHVANSTSTALRYNGGNNIFWIDDNVSKNIDYLNGQTFSVGTGTETTSFNKNIGNIVALQGMLDLKSTASTTTATGLIINANNHEEGALSNLVGARIGTNNHKGTIRNMDGLIVTNYLNGGSISNIQRGINIEIANREETSIPNVTGIQSKYLHRGTIQGEYIGLFNSFEPQRAEATVGNFYGYRLNLNFTRVAANAEGKKILATNAYGLHMDDVNFASGENYAIYTKAGKVRFGDDVESTGSVTATSFKGSNGATIFPDYVFQKYYTGTSSIKSDYSFKTLSQVEDFVKTNGHLPGYKSAEVIKAQGYVDLMETQLTNVEKIEELYLHLMEKDKEVQDLKQRLERLEKLIK